MHSSAASRMRSSVLGRAAPVSREPATTATLTDDTIPGAPL